MVVIVPQISLPLVDWNNCALPPVRRNFRGCHIFWKTATRSLSTESPPPPPVEINSGGMPHTAAVLPAFISKRVTFTSAKVGGRCLSVDLEVSELVRSSPPQCSEDQLLAVPQNIPLCAIGLWALQAGCRSQRGCRKVAAGAVSQIAS